MLRDYEFQINEQSFYKLVETADWPEAYELLTAPLHEWLYERQSFEAIDERTAVERLILSFDYVQMQVGQGGFIQLIQNGYVSLLVSVVEALQSLNLSPEMIPVLDDALKVFVLNKEVLAQDLGVEAFGRLYQEFREFEILEERFHQLQPLLIRDTVLYVGGQDKS